MSANINEIAVAEAAKLALKMGSAAVDVVSFVADLGEELPVVKPVLKTLKAIHAAVQNARNHREEVATLQSRCTYIAACFIVKCRQNSNSTTDVTPLENCVQEVLTFVERCTQRGALSRVLKASSDREQIAELNRRLNRVTGDMGLASIAALEGKADDMKAMLVGVEFFLLSTVTRSIRGGAGVAEYFVCKMWN